jgi:hypothetical protein
MERKMDRKGREGDESGEEDTEKRGSQKNM